MLSYYFSHVAPRENTMKMVDSFLRKCLFSSSSNEGLSNAYIFVSACLNQPDSACLNVAFNAPETKEMMSNGIFYYFHRSNWFTFHQLIEIVSSQL